MTDPSLESYLDKYLQRSESGEEVDLETFLVSAPSPLRDDLRRELTAVLKVKEAFGELKGSGAARHPSAIEGFRIDHELGRGAVGTVYAAEDLTLRRNVAIKVLSGGSESTRPAILEEARKLAAIAHPNIVTVYSVIDSPVPAIVMELVDGYPLDRTGLALTHRQRARLLQGIASALAAAHASGIIHRDLKPKNILVTPELVPKVLDFGLAFGRSQGESLARGRFEGTPLYASPEQIRGEAIGPRSDVFSFGCLAYQLLCGRVPFEADAVSEVFSRILEEDPPFPRSVDRSVPEELQTIVLACLAKERSLRPSAAEVCDELGRYLSGEPLRIRPQIYSDALQRHLSKHSELIDEWHDHGIIARTDRDQLCGVYRRLLSDEDHWVFDARRLSVLQLLLYSSTWLVFVASSLLVWFIREDLDSLWRWSIPAGESLALLAIGIAAHRRNDALAAGAFLSAAVLATVPSALSLLSEMGLFSSRPDDITQLMIEPYSNAQVLTSCALALGISIFALARLRLTGFAWTTAFLATGSYLSLLTLFDWLGKDPEIQAVMALPLVALIFLGLEFERRRFIRWALPFEAVAFVALILGLDVMAMRGPTLDMIGVPETPFFDEDRLLTLSLVLNGLVFAALMFASETARSLDLRRGSAWLEALVPLHILSALFISAQNHRIDEDELPVANFLGWDVTMYWVAVALLLVLSPIRSRRRFFLSGLVGLAAGSYLLIDLELVAQVPFIITIGLVGLGAAAASYTWINLRSQGNASVKSQGEA